MYSNDGLNTQGFSIIEPMIVISLIAILAAVAVPAYVGYTKSSKLLEASIALSTLRIRMEQFYQDNLTYINAVTNSCGAVAANTKYFTFTCVAANLQATQYIWQVSSKASVGQDSASTYICTIDQAGNEQTTAHPKISAVQNCWLIKKISADAPTTPANDPWIADDFHCKDFEDIPAYIYTERFLLIDLSHHA